MEGNVKAVVVLSGGMDSTTVLAQCLSLYGAPNVHAVSFNYGQRHVRELEMATTTCQRAEVEHVVLDIASVMRQLGGSALTEPGIAVPEGHYADPTMKKTVVPNRNMIFASIAAGYAVAVGASELWLGVHAGDHAIYPDCRPEFVAALEAVLAVANYSSVRIRAPYLYNTKTEILSAGMWLGVDYGLSWTCYNGREQACGRCGSCVERLEAFATLGMVDPLAYEAGR